MMQQMYLLPNCHYKYINVINTILNYYLPLNILLMQLILVAVTDIPQDFIGTWYSLPIKSIFAILLVSSTSLLYSGNSSL